MLLYDVFGDASHVMVVLRNLSGASTVGSPLASSQEIQLGRIRCKRAESSCVALFEEEVECRWRLHHHLSESQSLYCISITMATPTVQRSKLKYELNDRVLCQHTDNLYYDAKVVGVSTTASGVRLYTIHYKGWSKRYDEIFEESKAAYRLRPFTESDFAKAKAELKAAQAQNESTRRARIMSVRKRVPKKSSESRKEESVISTIPRNNINKDKSASVRAARALSARARSARKACRLSIGSAAAALRIGSGIHNTKTNEEELSENQVESTSYAKVPPSRTGYRKRKLVHSDNSLASTAEKRRFSGSEAGRNETDSHTFMSSAEKCRGVHNGGERKECPMSLCLSDDDRPFYDFTSKELPIKIQQVLKRDMELTLTGRTLARLPARSSTSKILNEFAKYMQRLNDVCGKPNRYISPMWRATACALTECVECLKDMMDVILTKQLLTEKELQRHEELVASAIIRTDRGKDIVGASQSSGLRPCEVYGYIHLLRLLVTFGPMQKSVITKDALVMEALKGFSSCLNLYLANHSEELFNEDEDYVPVSTQ
uniref:MRG domain-containing protein n=1 Tax=Parascaris univalens TaxID=6257 RepID=A0A915BMC1_PARUN